jgi:hypothetical protein
MCYTTRMRASVSVGATLVVVAALVGGCSSSSSKSSGTTTTKPTAVARAAPASDAELEARIVTKVPSDFVEQPPEAFDTGPSDLAKAIKDDGAPNAAKVLRAERFVRGYQRIWIGPSHAQIIVFVYQFASRVGARQDFARSMRDYDSKPPPGAHKFVMPGLPATQAFGVAGSFKDSAAALVFFTTGVFDVQINCNAPTSAGLQARAIAIAKVQLRRL